MSEIFLSNDRESLLDSILDLRGVRHELMLLAEVSEEVEMLRHEP
jgi:hypothetical protein